MVLSVICIKFLLKGFLLKVQLESPDSWGVHSMIKAFVLCSARDSQLCTITTQSHSSKGAHTLHKSDIDTSCCFYRKSSSSSTLLLLLLQFQSLVYSTCNYYYTQIQRDARPPKVNDIPGSNGSHPLFISSHCSQQRRFVSSIPIFFATLQKISQNLGKKRI